MKIVEYFIIYYRLYSTEKSYHVFIEILINLKECMGTKDKNIHKKQYQNI